jgi:hypothetical protein
MKGAALQRVKLPPGTGSLHPVADKRYQSPRAGLLRSSIRVVLSLSRSDQEPARANICQRSIKGRCVSRRPHNLKVNVLQLVEHRPGGVEELESYIAVLSPSLQEQ